MTTTTPLQDRIAFLRKTLNGLRELFPRRDSFRWAAEGAFQLQGDQMHSAGIPESEVREAISEVRAEVGLRRRR